MPKLDRQTPTQRPFVIPEGLAASSSGMPPGPNSSGWRDDPGVDEPAGGRVLDELGAAAAEEDVDAGADVGGEERPPRLDDLAGGGVGWGREKPAAISAVQRRWRSSRQWRSKEAAYSDASVRAISAAPPGDRQSTSTSRPCRAMWARNARPNS